MTRRRIKSLKAKKAALWTGPLYVLYRGDFRLVDHICKWGNGWSVNLDGGGWFRCESDREFWTGMPG